MSQNRHPLEAEMMQVLGRSTKASQTEDWTDVVDCATMMEKLMHQSEALSKENTTLRQEIEMHKQMQQEFAKKTQVRRIADQHAVAHLPARSHADGHAGSGRHDVYARHPALGAERALLRDGARNDRRQGVHSEQR